MYMRYGVLADAVVSTGGGKWAAIGTFQVIWAPSFPHKHQRVGILIRLENDRPDLQGDDRHSFAIDFVSPIGERINGVTGSFGLPGSEIEGAPAALEIGLEIMNLVVPKAGNYDFAVRVDGSIVDMIPLYVRDVADRPAQSP
jgi:hypothetical protein